MQKSLECCDDTQSLAYARQTLENLLLEEASDVNTGQGQQPQAQQKIVAVQKVICSVSLIIRISMQLHVLVHHRLCQTHVAYSTDGYIHVHTCMQMGFVFLFAGSI